MRIAILLPDLRGGGVERIRLVLAKEFLRLGHSPEFVLMRAQGELLGEAHETFTISDLSCARARQLPIALARYLRKSRPDGLLAAMWPLTVIAPVAQLLSGHRCSVVVSEHCMLTNQYATWGTLHKTAMRFSMAAGYRPADGIVGVSNGVVADLASLSGLGSQRFTTIHNPVTPRQVPSPDAHEQAESIWAGAPQGQRLLSVGSLKNQKNHSLLLRAFARIESRRPTLMILGTGPNKSMVRRLAAELDVADRVIFAGFHPDPTPFYSTADLFVLSSDNEGFGNVIVEALAQGLPVVSTDCPSGPSEILENGRWGRLVPVGDSEALAKAMVDALMAEHDHDALKRRAADFSPEIAARKYLDLMFPT